VAPLADISQVTSEQVEIVSTDILAELGPQIAQVDDEFTGRG
jgi:hypothetical protein